MSGPRVVGIDLSLTSTGLADNRGRVERIRTVAIVNNVPKILRRMDRILTSITTFVDGREEDERGNWLAWNLPALVVVEGPSFASPGQQQHTRAGLWWVVVAGINGGPLVNDPPIPILVVPPATRAMYATGRGNASKDEVLAAAIKRYPSFDHRQRRGRRGRPRRDRGPDARPPHRRPEGITA